MMTRMSCPSALSALGRAPATSARPPTFAKGATSAATKRIFMVGTPYCRVRADAAHRIFRAILSRGYRRPAMLAVAELLIINVREQPVSLVQLGGQRAHVRTRGSFERGCQLFEASNMVPEALDRVLTCLARGHQERPVTALQQEELTG